MGDVRKVKWRKRIIKKREYEKNTIGRRRRERDIIIIAFPQAVTGFGYTKTVSPSTDQLSGHDRLEMNKID